MKILFGSAVNGKRQVVVNDVNIIISEDKVQDLLFSEKPLADKQCVNLETQDVVKITMTKADIECMRFEYEKKLNQH